MQIIVTWETVVTETRTVVLEGDDIPDFLGSALEAGYDLDLDTALVSNVYRGVSSDEIEAIRGHLRDYLADREDGGNGWPIEPTNIETFSREIKKIETVR
jgi:hypothetical protein